jgi:hypothetical protein
MLFAYTAHFAVQAYATHSLSWVWDFSSMQLAWTPNTTTSIAHIPTYIHVHILSVPRGSQALKHKFRSNSNSSTSFAQTRTPSTRVTLVGRHTFTASYTLQFLDSLSQPLHTQKVPHALGSHGPEADASPISANAGTAATGGSAGE